MIKPKLTPIHLLLILALSVPGLARAIDVHDTRMLSQPAIGGGHIAFIYAEDLWVANIDGSQPRRLTVDQGVESSPVISPDGKTIAFSAQYEGNTDVYTIPIEGGVPKRLTWHPGADFVRGFTPDGKSILFISQRLVFTSRYFQLYTVPLTGGPATQLPIPNAYWAGYSPDGKKLAFTPGTDAFRQWKHYRGGQESQIWIFNFADNSTVKIPQPTGGCNDVNPVWLGNTIYFRSDRNGEFNLFAYDVASAQITQVTDFKDFPILNASGADGKIIFEQAGYLHIAEKTAAPKKLTIGIAADLLELRPRFVKGAQYIRTADISPTGTRAVFDFRGDIITAPADKGDFHNITATTAVHERSATWSPDGRTIAYLSDASGEYKLHIHSLDGKNTVKILPLTGTGFYANLHWSPDGKKISYVDNGRDLFVLDVASGATKKIASDEYYTPGPFRELFGDWSYDSKWIAYTKVTTTQFKRAYLYSIDQDKSFPLTDGLSDVSEPHFDPDGKWIVFLASTDAGPVLNWFDQSNDDARSTSSIYLVTLHAATLSPFAKESDEEKAKDTSTAKPPAAAAAAAAKPAPLTIDWPGIENRIIDVPVGAGNYGNLSVGKEDILYIEYPDDGQGTLHKFNFKKRTESSVMQMDGYILSADQKKMLYKSGPVFGISGAGDKPEPGKGIINVDQIQIKIEPTAEWPEIFDEAWRVNRDYFYDPNMHGVDWPAMKKKYAVFLPDLSCRSDLNSVFQWMFSELRIGHHFITDGGDRKTYLKPVPGGLLGADYSISDNRYRFKKIYGGLNWNPRLRSPLTEPGVNVKTGEYLLAVNGQEVSAAEDIYMYFENTAGKIVELTVGPSPTLAGSRVVKVVPVENEYALRNRDWVEGNLKKVTEATNGKVAYVYVPNTAGLGHEYFKRYFFPQADRKAIIVDERFNGGGQLADYYIDILRRPYQAHWNMRYGRDLKSPSASIQGPKVMLIDENAGSGGDMLPWMFRKFQVGTLVGKRTWGGLVGILGFPEFIDGGTVTAPNVGIWTKDGWPVENIGVEPDIEVEQTPSEVIAGHDPQLEKAIQIALQELEKNPQPDPVRPPYPIKK